MTRQSTPTGPTGREDLPRPTTFFLNEREHRAVLQKLRSQDASNRSEALCRALGIDYAGTRG